MRSMAASISLAATTPCLLEIGVGGAWPLRYRLQNYGEALHAWLFLTSALEVTIRFFVSAHIIYLH